MATQISSLYTTKPFRTLFDLLITTGPDPLHLILTDDHYCCKSCTMKIICAYNPDFHSLYNILRGDINWIHLDDVTSLKVEYDSDVFNIIYKIQCIHNDDNKKVPVKQLPVSDRENLERLFAYKNVEQKLYTLHDYYNLAIPHTHGIINRKVRKPKYMQANYIKAYINNLVYDDELFKAYLHVLNFDFDDVVDILIEHRRHITPGMLDEMYNKVLRRSVDDNIIFLEFLIVLTDSVPHIDIMIKYCLCKQDIPEVLIFLNEIIEQKDMILQESRSN